MKWLISPLQNLITMACVLIQIPRTRGNAQPQPAKDCVMWLPNDEPPGSLKGGAVKSAGNAGRETKQ